MLTCMESELKIVFSFRTFHVCFTSRSSFSDFCSRYKNDERYKSIEKMRDRENLFNDYLMELRKKEKDEKQNKKEQVRSKFVNVWL